MEYQDDFRQYYCPECGTITTIKDGIRDCNCDNILASFNWIEIFLDRIKE